ncbi:MAG: phosphatidylglycerol lysyltransferase domain-containing protein [Patescibacteria group bacterium]
MDKIPKFPKFKNLKLSDKEKIESLVAAFLPFSDYNFLSLWSWNISEQTQISILNKNLVIKFNDYLTNDTFYSLFGEDKIDSSIGALFKYIKKNQKTNILLRLVPESTIKHIVNKKNYHFNEDRDNFDYIFSVNKMCDLRGGRYRGKKNFINRFKRTYGERAVVKELDIQNNSVQNDIIKLFADWKKSRGKTSKEIRNEFFAVKRLLKYCKSFNLVVVGIFIDSKLKAVSINEVVQKNYGIVHFQKADASYTGIFQFLTQQSAIAFKKLGCRLINYEQDLGIEGLRNAKLMWHPVKFFKKYIILEQI